MSREQAARAWLANAGRALLDLLFPPRCPACGKVGVALCAGCQAKIEPLPAAICPRCGHPGEPDVLCVNCADAPSHLDRIVATAIFAPPLREIIHELKYSNSRTVAQPLGDRMAVFWQARGLTADLIVPVPLHRSRQAERGYNQAALLAYVLGQAVGVPRERARRGAAESDPAAGACSRPAERRVNVKEAFVCRGDVTGKRIVLVDDVCTTGATLEACAKALKAAGAASVWAFTLARARWEPGQPSRARLNTPCREIAGQLYSSTVDFGANECKILTHGCRLAWPELSPRREAAGSPTTSHGKETSSWNSPSPARTSRSTTPSASTWRRRSAGWIATCRTSLMAASNCSWTKAPAPPKTARSPR